MRTFLSIVAILFLCTSGFTQKTDLDSYVDSLRTLIESEEIGSPQSQQNIKTLYERLNQISRDANISYEESSSVTLYMQQIVPSNGIWYIPRRVSIDTVTQEIRRSKKPNY